MRCEITKRSRVPEYHYACPQSKAIMDALERAAGRLEDAQQDVMAQLDVRTATWGLPLWENDVGIVPAQGDSLETRRSAIMARLRGSGVANVERIQAVADAWRNGEVEVSEGAGVVTLTFVGALGIPEDMDALKTAIRDTVSAHVAVEYLLRYLLIGDVHEKMTLAELEATPLDYFAGGNYGE